MKNTLQRGGFPVDLINCYKARQRISSYIRRTPLIFSPSFSQATGANVWFKLECMQRTGSFKLRGAANRILQLDESHRKLGIVAVSSGNHGRAVAYMANQLGLKAIVCLCDLVPRNKVEAISRYGAEVRIVGHSQDDAQVEADRLVEEEGMTWIAPYDDPEIIAGQGTILLEVVEEMPDIDFIVAPLSGGGLVSGIAIAAKSMSPSMKVIGASMDQHPGMVESLKVGRPVTVPEHSSLADSLGGSIGLNNRYTFPIVRDFMDDAVLVAEDELAPAMKRLLHDEGLVIEGGSAVAVAALLKGGLGAAEGKNVVVVISGRNIAMDRFRQAVGELGGET